MSELIKISKEFRGISGGLWLGMETTIEAESDQEVIEAYKKKNDLLEKVFMALNPSINWEERKPNFYGGMEVPYGGGIGEPNQTPKEKQLQSFIEAINTTTSSKSLEIFRKLVERENNQSLSEAFNNQEKKLKTTNHE